MRKCIITTLALVASIGYARADYAPIVQPRIMAGLFCNTEEQIKTVVTNGHPSMEAFNVAMAEINAEKTVCLLHTSSRVLVSSMTFLGTDTYSDEKLWLYKAEAVGYRFGNSNIRVEPPVMLYVYMTAPLDPSHKDNDA